MHCELRTNALLRDKAPERRASPRSRRSSFCASSRVPTKASPNASPVCATRPEPAVSVTPLAAAPTPSAAAPRVPPRLLRASGRLPLTRRGRRRHAVVEVHGVGGRFYPPGSMGDPCAAARGPGPLRDGRRPSVPTRLPPAPRLSQAPPRAPTTARPSGGGSSRKPSTCCSLARQCAAWSNEPASRAS